MYELFGAIFTQNDIGKILHITAVHSPDYCIILRLNDLYHNLFLHSPEGDKMNWVYLTYSSS